MRQESDDQSNNGKVRSIHDDNHFTISKLHIVVLVHGWLGNPKEMDYLKQSLYHKLLQTSNSTTFHLPKDSNILAVAVPISTDKATTYEAFVIHSAESNTGPILTSDGIAAGGQRVADEIDQIVTHYSQQCQQPPVSLSLVGNSLGGLYCRYAISRMQCLSKVVPKFFVTTCTPHLGVSQHTYLTIPTWMEAMIAWFMQQTGQDLFRRSMLIQDMTVNTIFLQPLLAFERRIAYANVYGTDFQVPTSTAAFWADTDSVHHVSTPDDTKDDHHDHHCDNNIVLQLTTPQIPSPNEATIPLSNDLSSKELSLRLDQLGWTKVLVDVREQLPLSWKRSNSSLSSSEPDVNTTTKEKYSLISSQTSWTARELLHEFERGHFQPLPLGHTVMLANAKDSLNRYLTKGGKSTMDYLASTILQNLLDKDKS